MGYIYLVIFWVSLGYILPSFVVHIAYGFCCIILTLYMFYMGYSNLGRFKTMMQK